MGWIPDTTRAGRLLAGTAARAALAAPLLLAAVDTPRAAMRRRVTSAPARRASMWGGQETVGTRMQQQQQQVSAVQHTAAWLHAYCSTGLDSDIAMPLPNPVHIHCAPVQGGSRHTTHASLP